MCEVGQTMVAHCDVGTPTEMCQPSPSGASRLPRRRNFCDAAAYTQRVLRARRLSTRAGKLHFGMNDECDAERVP